MIQVNKFLMAITRACHTLLHTNAWLHPDFRPDELQRIEFFPSSVTVGYDLKDFYEKNFSQTALQGIAQTINGVVLYKNHNPTFNGKPLSRFFGLTTYVPGDAEQTGHDYYKTLLWYQAAGHYRIFDTP